MRMAFAVELLPGWATAGADHPQSVDRDSPLSAPTNWDANAEVAT